MLKRLFKDIFNFVKRLVLNSNRASREVGPSNLTFDPECKALIHWAPLQYDSPISEKNWIPKESERKNSLPCRTKVKYHNSLHMLHIYFTHELFDMSSIIWTVWKVSNFHWKLTFFDLLVSLLQILSSFHIYKMNSNNWVLEAWVWSKLVSLMNQYTQN